MYIRNLKWTITPTQSVDAKLSLHDSYWPGGDSDQVCPMEVWPGGFVRGCFTAKGFVWGVTVQLWQQARCNIKSRIIWLRAAERIKFTLHGGVDFLVSVLCSPPLPVRSTNSCRWYSFSSAPSIIRHRRSTCPPDAARHCRWSGVSGRCCWKFGDVTASASLTVFRRQLNTFVSCILSWFIICTARRFAIAVFTLTFVYIILSLRLLRLTQ